MSIRNAREDMNSTCRTSYSASHLTPPLSTPLSSASTIIRTPITPQQTSTNHFHMCHRYTTVTLLSLRPPPEITIFPDHLVERRFLDEENYIDIDRMLIEKAGKFDLESFNMRDGPIMPSRIHKYDFSDQSVIEKVKNRRPKDLLTPQQVAALTSVVTRHQPSTIPTSLVYPHQEQSSHIWIDDYSHGQVQQQQRNSYHHHHLPPQPSMPYQRQNPNQCETYTNQFKPLLPTYQSNIELKNETKTIPILQRLFEAQRQQQNERCKIDLSQPMNVSNGQLSSFGYHQPGLSAFCTPGTPMAVVKQDQTVLSQFMNEHFNCSTTMQTPATPSVDIGKFNNMTRDSDDDDIEQKFYSAPPSPTQQKHNLLSLFNKLNNDGSYFSNDIQVKDNRSSLENWFGTNIYTSAYPRMPSNRVVSSCDLEH